ncbi:aldo/keto reductase [Streptomyces sp. MBT62]|uniref:aldo/keto reductase n=1 Tax=Streptomyces sp. MBT62 TaxID=2800410 RepID=UPI00190B3C78|nr:aldo/keto reductase [Streptomyces sp. MBT62]MBK3565212.1 aldo/keto reductase [Streptomyces sp. MBT62]
MDFRRIGDSGLVVSSVGLGTSSLGFGLDLDACREVVHAALDHGITLFDTADSYGTSEERLGQLLHGHRDDVVIATKFGEDIRRNGLSNGEDWGARGSRRYIVRAVESSLRRLRTDWIDLYQLHRPDPATPVEETLGTLTDLVRDGKIRYLGSSNLDGWQVAHSEWTARTRGLERFISAQNEYNWLSRGIEADIVPALEHYRIGLLPYFPLASGLLTGKYRRGGQVPEGSRIQQWGLESTLTDGTFDVLERLERFAQDRGLGLLDIAIGGLAAKPFVAGVISGATSATQVARNAAAARWRPSVEELSELDAITSPSALNSPTPKGNS